MAPAILHPDVGTQVRGDTRHQMWVPTPAMSPYMVATAAGSAPNPGASRQEGTRCKSGTAPQR